MMITEAVIKNFKCFKQLTLPDLGRITIVGGKNNVGKTALLESLFLFFDRTSPNMILRQYGWRGLGRVTSTPEGMWAPIFRNYNLNKPISISVWIDEKMESAVFNYNPNFMLNSLPPGEKPQRSGQKSVRTDVEPVPSFSLDIEYDNGSETRNTAHLLVSPKGSPGLKLDYVVSGLKPAIFLPAKMQISSKETSERFSKLQKTKSVPKALHLLEIIEPRLKELANITEGPDPVIYGDIGLPEMIPIPLMGEGMSHILDIILAMAYCENGTLFIDEVDNGIHRSLLPKIWEAISNATEDYNCQIIATTHSYECLESIHKGLANRPNDLRYIRLSHEGDVATAKTSNYDMLGSGIQHNMEIR